MTSRARVIAVISHPPGGVLTPRRVSWLSALTITQSAAFLADLAELGVLQPLGDGGYTAVPGEDVSVALDVLAGIPAGQAEESAP